MELQLFQADVTNVTCHVTSRVRDVTEDCTTPLSGVSVVKDSCTGQGFTSLQSKAQRMNRQQIASKR